MSCSYIAHILVIIGIAAAAAIELRPALAAVGLGINMSLCKIGFHFLIEGTIVYIAHFVLVDTHELMTRKNISVRSYSHIVVSAAAAPQSLYSAGALIEVKHEVEEVELFALLLVFKKLVAGRGDKEYYVRGTFTNHNLDFSEDVFALYDAGFDQISIEPVVGDSDEYALREKDLPAVFKEYEVLAKRILDNEKAGKKFNFFDFMIDLDQGPCAIKRLRGCGCGNDYVAITPDGDIFPCHQFVGIDEYKMGNIDEGTFNQDMKADFAAAHVYSKPECRQCWAKFYCSGGCNANNYQYMGDIRTAHKLSCQLEKKRLECAIMMKAVRTFGKPLD